MVVTMSTTGQSTIFRVVTAGSVDNGKSTLIGRLLYDSKKILQDHWENIEAAKLKYGNEDINLAFLTDGLKAEREQGITIDVAYRYFSTLKRKYILADCPGHIQYTKNMITGSSTADATIILIDGEAGFSEQSKRHAYLSMMLGVSHIIFAVNKMDLLHYSQNSYEDLCNVIKEWLPGNCDSKIHFVPTSALTGENIVHKSEKMTWYNGASLIDLLDNLDLRGKAFDYLRYPVQWVIRPQSKNFHNYRAYAGTVVGGRLRVGDEIMDLYSGLISKVKQIQIGTKLLDEAGLGLSTSILLEDDLDISRGSLLVSPVKVPQRNSVLKAMAVCLNQNSIQINKPYLLKHNSKWLKVIVKDISKELNLEKLEFEIGKSSLNLNCIGEIVLHTSEDLFYDPYSENKTMGSLILVDPLTNETIGAAMLS